MAEYESLFGGAKETGGGEGGGAKGDKGGGGTKGGTREAVHRAMGVGGAVVDEVMAMLGFGGRARERREKGTQGQGADVDAAMEAVFARALKGEEGGEKRGKGRWGGRACASAWGVCRAGLVCGHDMGEWAGVIVAPQEASAWGGWAGRGRRRGWRWWW